MEGTGFVAGDTGKVLGSGEHMEHPKNPFPPKVLVTPISAEALFLQVDIVESSIYPPTPTRPSYASDYEMKGHKLTRTRQEAVL